MKLSPKKLGLTFGILWALAILGLSVYPWLAGKLFDAPEKGTIMLELLENTYPWFNHTTVGGALAGAVVGFVDAFIGGFLIGWLYNKLPGKK